MRILKYILLLSLLVFFAVSVFVATQKGNFEVERSKVVNSPRATVYNYINDYRNWENFGSWKTDDPKMRFTYSQNTVGKGGGYSWQGSDGDGNVTTTSVVENQAITQKMNYNGSISEVQWKFKDTLGGTKITWKSAGDMSFGFKIYTAFNGGVDKVIGTMYERSLNNLDKSLDYEMNTYNIKIDGVVKKTQTYYLGKRITSTISNVPKNIRIILPKLIYFFKKNKMTMYGKPFIIYHTYDTGRGITDMSVCVPVNDAITISEGSDISAGKLDSFQALKTTLTGDYSHLKETWTKSFDYIAKQNLSRNEAGSIVELYSVYSEIEKHPSKWVTTLYIPLKEKAAPVAVFKPKPVVPTAVIEEAAVPEP